MNQQRSHGALSILLGDHDLWLLPERAVWCPQTRTLFVADLHLGKSASFRAHGVPVPSGTTQDNLARLDALVLRHGAGRLVFLGDFLHAAPAQQPQVQEPVQAWRARHPQLDCVLVRGNHDNHAGDPPAALRFDIVDEPWHVDGADSPLVACHHPQTVAGATVLAGHWHPAVTLRGPARDRQRLPCFCHVDGCLVLPAFGAFTGSSSQPLPRHAGCYAIGGGRVWRLPAVTGDLRGA